MPNWCSCDLYIAGPKRNLIHKAIQSVDAEGYTSHIDFNKIITMPAILEGTTSPPQAGDIRAEHAKRETGYSDWYEWCRANWGTKWPASQTELREGKKRDKISFETAWSPPSPVILALSRMFPENTFTLKFYERGMAYKGEYTVKSGNVLVSKQDKYYGRRGG